MNRVEQRLSAASSGLCLRCLGSFRLQDGAGNTLQVRTRKARALLAYLALTGRPASREKLADLLWSDRAEEQARASVRQALFDLRRTTGGSPAAAAPCELDIAMQVPPTDLELIRIAAESGDDRQLHALLASSEPGLLTDLDGLDPEYDAWLRTERAQEPSRTLQIALEAARHCYAEQGARAARPIVAEIQRLDPSFEETGRLALRIDHELGDAGALHRHFELLRRHLRDEYDAEPSRETVELFEQLKRRRRGSQEAGDQLPAGNADRLSAAEPGALRVFGRRWGLAAASFLVVLLLGALGWLLLQDRRAPADEARKSLVIAVLPFESHPAQDRFLAEGLWDDTRTALSRNPSFRVLGRSTARALAGEHATAEEYRRRLAVDYLLEGSVRRSGEQVRIAVSLTRTRDGVAIWNSVFQGRVGDPMALQVAVADGIEGRLRGRLARGGGRRADQIATSPAVYSLYSEARARMRDRALDELERAEGLLRRAVALDPNFAPAWSALGAALYLGQVGPVVPDEQRRESIAFVERALALAPNLAEAHATRALIAGAGSRHSEAALERALALDPGNAEAWNWLGNVRNYQFRSREALTAYRRAAEIDPFWFPAIHNLVTAYSDGGMSGEAQQLVHQLRLAGADEQLIVSTDALAKSFSGDLSGAASALLDFRRRSGVRNDSLLGLGVVLRRLGYADETASLWNYYDWYGPVLRSERLPPEVIGGRPVSMREFWENEFFAVYAGRAMVNQDAGDRLVRRYRQAFRTRDEFVDALAENGTLDLVAPSLSVALRQSGSEQDADAILAAAAGLLEQFRPRAGDNRELLWRLGAVRAAQGRRQEALQLIGRAIRLGWLPDGLFCALDLAQEPALRGLRGDPRFEGMRRRILGHIARERAELGPVTI